MLKKLRIVLTASLLVAGLISNANAFTTDSEATVSTSRSTWCSVDLGGGWWLWYPC